MKSPCPFILLATVQLRNWEKGFMAKAVNTSDLILFHTNPMIYLKRMKLIVASFHITAPRIAKQEG